MMNIPKKTALRGLMILVALVGVKYVGLMVDNGGAGSIIFEHSHSQSVPIEFSALKNPISLTDESVIRGKEIYVKNCYRCHGFSGNGNGPDTIGLGVSSRDLTDKSRMAHHSDGDFFYWITYGVGREKLMPSYGENLTESERWDLVNYIKTLY